MSVAIGPPAQRLGANAIAHEITPLGLRRRICSHLCCVAVLSEFNLCGVELGIFRAIKNSDNISSEHWGLLQPTISQQIVLAFQSMRPELFTFFPGSFCP